MFVYYAFFVELLLEWKSDIEAVDSNNNTALHLACQRRHSAAAAVLLDKIESLEKCNDNTQKASGQRNRIVNIINKQQKTPLHLAARNGLVGVSFHQY